MAVVAVMATTAAIRIQFTPCISFSLLVQKRFVLCHCFCAKLLPKNLMFHKWHVRCTRARHDTRSGNVFFGWLHDHKCYVGIAMMTFTTTSNENNFQLIVWRKWNPKIYILRMQRKTCFHLHFLSSGSSGYFTLQATVDRLPVTRILGAMPVAYVFQSTDNFACSIWMVCQMVACNSHCLWMLFSSSSLILFYGYKQLNELNLHFEWKSEKNPNAFERTLFPLVRWQILKWKQNEFNVAEPNSNRE